MDISIDAAAFPTRTGTTHDEDENGIEYDRGMSRWEYANIHIFAALAAVNYARSPIQREEESDVADMAYRYTQALAEYNP